jgi:hypothetical protein
MPPTEANSAKTAESLAARAVKSGPVGVESKLSTTTGHWKSTWQSVWASTSIASGRLGSQQSHQGRHRNLTPRNKSVWLAELPMT